MSERSQRHDDRPGGAAKRTGLGPIVLLIPLLSLVVGVLWARRARPPWGGARPRPPVVDDASEREAWVGETTRDGARIVARLLPLHEAPERLAFERDILAERLRLGPGRPWRLELACHELDTPAPALALTGIVVKHGAGELLPAVPRAPEPEPGGVVDPLRTLLAPPSSSLEPGHALTLVLWGPLPEGEVRLVTAELDLPLEARRVAAALVPETLARLDRGGAR